MPEAARWETIRAAAKQPDIGKRIIDEALVLIERENPNSRASSTNAMPLPSCRVASLENWWM
ncbi:hypothetical protein CCP3SC15_40003 [Gammaproteobacteria bacterium]